MLCAIKAPLHDAVAHPVFESIHAAAYIAMDTIGCVCLEGAYSPLKVQDTVEA